MENFRKINVGRELYENLGKLFYAMAAADEEVQQEEVRALGEVLRKEWLSIEDTKDEFGTDLSFQIEVIFDWYKENRFSSEVAFQKFVDYKKAHEHLFTEEINALIWNTVYRIAAAFPKRSRAELVLLLRLKEILHVSNRITKTCQSCGSIFDINRGTNHDQSLSEEYCSGCYQNGRFLDQSLTLRKLEMTLKERAEKNDEMTYEELEQRQIILPQLKRWKTSRR